MSPMERTTARHDVVVGGAGQAGPAIGHHLPQEHARASERPAVLR